MGHLGKESPVSVIFVTNRVLGINGNLCGLGFLKTVSGSSSLGNNLFQNVKSYNKWVKMRRVAFTNK